MTRQVWVVEMKGRYFWHPVTGGFLRREEATNERDAWKASNPSDTFRAWKYLASPEPRRSKP
jgi:hypothetical protein